MPPSRIAFALGDFVGEIARLMPKDASAQVLIGLDPVTFGRAKAELSGYSALQEAPPIFPGSGESLETFRFGGVSFCRLPEHVKLDG